MRSHRELSDVDPAHRECSPRCVIDSFSRPANSEIYRWHIYNAACTLLAISIAATDTYVFYIIAERIAKEVQQIGAETS